MREEGREGEREGEERGVSCLHQLHIAPFLKVVFNDVFGRKKGGLYWT